MTGIVGYTSVQDEITRTSEESQPHSMLRTLEYFTTHFSKTEDGAQGYIITGDSAYLEQYSANIGHIGNHYKQLCAFPNRTPLIAKHLTTLDGLLNKKLFEFSSCIELRRNYNMIKPAADFMKKYKSRLLNDSLQTIIQDLQREQRELLQQTTATWQHNRLVPLWWGVGTSSVLLLIFALYSIISHYSLLRNIQFIVNLIEQMTLQQLPTTTTKSVSKPLYPLLQAIRSLAHTQREQTAAVSGLYNQLLESLNNSPHGFVVVRSLRSGSLTGKNQISDFEIVFCNTAATRLLTGKTAPCSGKRLKEMIHPSHVQATLERYATVADTGVASTSDEVYHQTFFAVTAVKFETGLLLLYVPHSHS